MIGDRTDKHGARAPGRERSPGLAARALLVFGIGLALAIPIARAEGQTIDGLNAKLAGARDQAQALGTEIEGKIVALASARAQAAAAASREAELSQVLAKGRERAAELGERVDEARAELAEARRRLERAHRALAGRLVQIYKSGAPDAIGVLLSSDGFEDLTTRAELLDRVQDADRALAERVRELRAALADQLAAVAEAKREADAFNARIDAARAEIAAARAAAERRASALKAARAAQVAALGSLKSQMATWSQRVQRLEQVSAAEAQSQVAGWTGTGDFTIPEAIVMCESGGSYSALNPSSGAGGAYQILPSTWEQYGGKGSPHEASPAEQDAIAAQIWADSGPGAWVCAG